MNLEQKILERLATASGTALGMRQLAAALQMKGKERKRLQRRLDRLVQRGRIVQRGPDRYAAPAPAPAAVGRLRCLRSGKGLVLDEESGREIWIPARRLGRALPGDRVQVRGRSGRAAAPGDRNEGLVEAVLDRTRREFPGTLRRRRRQWQVVPLDPRQPQVYDTDPPQAAQENDRVMARFVRWDEGRSRPACAVVERLGSAADPAADTVSVIRQYGFQETFPSPACREAETAAERFEAGRGDEREDRADLRETFTLTVDPPDARDFDDAVSLETRADQIRTLGVHIADVGWFVQPEGELDREAWRRGASVYFPDRVIPMLPPALSNGACSLRPDEDRLTLSVFMDFDASGHVLQRRFARSLIRSRARLTYPQALAWIEGREPDGLPALSPARRAECARVVQGLHALAQTLRRRRMESLALDFEMPEPEIVLDRKGEVREVRLVHGDVAHHLIEECMIAANEAVAWTLAAAGMGVLSRYHAPPETEKLDELKERLERLGYAPGNLRDPRRFVDFLRACRGDPLERYLQTLALRSLKRACYSATHSGHFGLAKNHYAHFTSPIRRYPDLVVHRQLAAWLRCGDRGRRSGFSPPAPRPLAETAAQASATERAADEAARDVEELMTFRFLQRQTQTGRRRVYPAVIVEVRRFGCFVEIPDLRVQGLVRQAALAAKAGPRRRARVRSRSSGLRAGARLRVRIESVDMEKRQLNFTLAEGGRA